jgi:hypothetical protein
MLSSPVELIVLDFLKLIRRLLALGALLGGSVALMDITANLASELFHNVLLSRHLLVCASNKI